MRTAALVILSGAAIYLIGLGLLALVDQRRAFAFLRRFAQTQAANLFEMTCRLLAGLAFVRLAPELPMPSLFRGAGVLLAVSAILLSVLPRFHRRFANRVMPAIERALPLVGLISLMLGCGLVVLLAPLIAVPTTPY